MISFLALKRGLCIALGHVLPVRTLHIPSDFLLLKKSFKLRRHGVANLGGVGGAADVLRPDAFVDNDLGGFVDLLGNFG